MMLKRFFRSRIGRSFVVLFGLALFTHFLDSRGYLHGAQMALGLDPMLQVTAPGTPSEIGIVEITEDDYRNYFCGQSPLDGRGVIALVEAVREKLHPAVIGVDLDTSDWKPGDIPAPCYKLDLPPCTHKTDKGENAPDQTCMANEVRHLVTENYPTKVVWAEIPREIPAEQRLKWYERLARLPKFLWTGEPEESKVLQLQTVAGRSPDSLVSGIPRFPLDLDGVVRKYRRRIEVEPSPDVDVPNPPKSKEQDSLPHALASACEACVRDNRAWQEEERHHSSEDVILKFATSKSVFNPKDANDLLPPLPGATKEKPTQANIEQALSIRPLTIVLIGGTYKGARDIYRTPLGEMPGVQLLAQALETDLHEGISETSEYTKFCADLLAGLGVIFLWNSKIVSRYAPLKRIFSLTLFGIPGAFLLLSLYLFHHRIWLDSIAILVGVVIHQVYEEFDKIKEYTEEIEHKDCTIAGLKKRLEESRGAEPQPASASAVSASKSDKADE
jgi:CHASE2 domain